MTWFVQHMLILIVFLFFTSPNACFKPSEYHSEEKLLPKVRNNAKEPPAKISRDVKTQTSGIQYNDDKQMCLWSPDETAIEFLNRAADYLNKSGLFEEKQVYGFVTDMDGGMIAILKEKNKSGEYSKKRLEISTNFDMSGYMIDICDGDVSDEQMKVITDALTRASIDSTGNISSSVKQMLQFIDFYQNLDIGLPVGGLIAVATAADRETTELLVWSPYKQGVKYLKRVFYHLQKSGIFQEEQASSLFSDDEGGMLAILKQKTESGKYSPRNFERSMNFDMSGAMVDLCDGAVSNQQMTLISDALTQASLDTTRTISSSVGQMMEFIVCYEKLAVGGSRATAGSTTECSPASYSNALDDVYDSAEDALGVLSNYADDAIDYADDAIDYADDVIDYAEESVGKICDNNTQLFLWSPYERALKFLKIFSYYSLKSGFFTEMEVAGFVTDMEDSIPSILKEKFQSGKFSIKHLESSMNFDFASWIVDMCHGDASDRKRTVIADALKQASIDTTGKISCSVKQILKFIDFYESIAVGLNDQALAAVGTISEGAGIKQFLWSPYNQGSNFVNLTSHYLRKSRTFEEKQVSGMKRRVLGLLNAKTKSGKFSKLLLEASMNFDVSASMVDICDGEVSNQQMTAIANALTRASVETAGTEPTSLRRMTEFIVFYEGSVFGSPAAVAATVAAASGTAAGTVSSVSTLPACVLEDVTFNNMWGNVLKQLGIPSYFL